MSDREDMAALADKIDTHREYGTSAILNPDNAKMVVKALRSAARTGPDVAVKPLEWDESGRADVYFVLKDILHAKQKFFMWRGDTILGWFDDEQDAKSAAQADFEQRIRSAITATVGTAEPGYQAGFEACREAARKCADDLIRICEAAARVTSRTGNTFVLDREKVATMIAGYFAALPAPAGESVTGWRPIETAPMDGSLILAASNITGTRWVVGWQPADPSQMEPFCEAHWNNVGSKNAAPAIYINANYFTHWQPLPPAPTITRKSKNEEAGS